MTPPILPACRPLLLGSLPGTDPIDAVDTVFRYTPDFPCWPQLPQIENETILQQFSSGLPGITSFTPGYGSYTVPLQEEIDLFSAEYEAVVSSQCNHGTSRFVLDDKHCSGLFALLRHLEHTKINTASVKGQIIGPLTLLTCIKDSQGTPLYSHRQLCHCAVQMLALKARWQVQQLRRYSDRPIIFIDEPMLFALGKPMLPEISSRDFLAMYTEIFRHIRDAGGICGIHVCGSTDWLLVLATEVEIISFDAFHYHRELLLLRQEIWHFINNGGMLAFGMVPTDTISLMQENVSSLFAKWMTHINELGGNVLDRERLFQQSFITPTCGTGRLTAEQSTAVLQMTAELSSYIRNRKDDTIYH